VGRGKTTDFSPLDGATLIPSGDDRCGGDIALSGGGGLFTETYEPIVSSLCCMKPQKRKKGEKSTGVTEKSTGAQRVYSNTKRRYQSGAHTVHRLRYHIVFIPKYRRQVLQGSISLRLKELFMDCFEANGWGLEELNIQPDHVHLLAQLPPSVSVSTCVKHLKGSSSYVIRSEFPALVSLLCGKSFWGIGYFVESVGLLNEEMIIHYIRNQGNVK
jgi:putative transposase